MAIDSEVKRKSIAAIGQRHAGPVVVPDGTIDQPDRQVIGYSYSGITASGAVTIITNQMQFSNLGADLFDGTLIGGL